MDNILCNTRRALVQYICYASCIIYNFSKKLLIKIKKFVFSFSNVSLSVQCGDYSLYRQQQQNCVGDLRVFTSLLVIKGKAIDTRRDVSNFHGPMTKDKMTPSCIKDASMLMPVKVI